jgi:hypothetical protein
VVVIGMIYCAVLAKLYMLYSITLLQNGRDHLGVRGDGHRSLIPLFMQYSLHSSAAAFAIASINEYESSDDKGIA